MHINNPRARTEVLKFIEEDNFIDVYRLLHDEKGFTWRKLNLVIKQARLYFFLVSEESFEFVYDNCVVSGYRTDHSGTILKLKFDNNERRKGYWKFNNSLLKDNEYEGCSNMNASSFITFFTYMLRQTFLERTICCLQNGTKHKETHTILLELQTLI